MNSYIYSIFLSTLRIKQDYSTLKYDLKWIHLGQNVQLLHNVLQSASKAWWNTRALCWKCCHAASKSFLLVFNLFFSGSCMSLKWTWVHSWGELSSAAWCTIIVSCILGNQNRKFSDDLKKIFFPYAQFEGKSSMFHMYSVQR